MRRRDEIGELKDRMCTIWRLRLKDIQRGAGDSAIAEKLR
jgi:hypothetical protein